MSENIMEWLLTYVLMPIAAVFLIFFVAMVVLLPIALLSGWKPPAQVAYEQCLEDGEKEYVCYSMMYVRSGK